MERRRIVLVRFRGLEEQVGDLHLGLAQDDARGFLTRCLGLAGHCVLKRSWNYYVAHLHRLDRDAPRI